MTTLAIILCLGATLFTLYKLCEIDLKIRLLPNKYVGLFFLLGILFHILTGMTYTSVTDILGGILCGGGMLFTIRQIANKIYGYDTLGLGDVKLLGAAGLWLGLSDIFLAISLGAFAGLFHGIAYKFYKQKKSGKNIQLKGLTIPAGPGFIFGILIVGIIKFYTLPAYLGM